VSEDEGYLKVPEEVDLFLEIPPHSSSLQWNTCNREVNSVIDEIKVKNIKQKVRPSIVLKIMGEGVYKISPVNCEIDAYSIRKQFLMRTTEEKFDDKVVLKADGIGFPISIILYYKKGGGRLYHSCMKIKKGRICYFGD